MSEIGIDHRLVLLSFLLYLQKPNLPVPSRILKKYTERIFFQVHCHCSYMLIILTINYYYGYYWHNFYIFLCASPIPHLATAARAVFCLRNRCLHVGLSRHEDWRQQPCRSRQSWVCWRTGDQIKGRWVGLQPWEDEHAQAWALVEKSQFLESIFPSEASEHSAWVLKET